MQLLHRMERFNLWDLLLHFLFFISSGKSIYDHHDWDLFDDICNTINEHNQRQYH